jgi:tRNA(fMet)-specific endonuclease VapC
MSLRFLLDTNICVYIRQKKSLKVLQHFDNLGPGEAAISVITEGELLYGAERSQNRERALAILSEIFSIIPVLSLPEGAGATYGQLRNDLERKGTIIGSNDLWIAAHAEVENLILVTNNEREFRRVEGLRIENWVKR